MTKRGKPQGASGAVSMGPGGVVFHQIDFPADKAEREDLVARLFVKAFEEWVASESEPSLKPFVDLKQNPENDIDFTVTTSAGVKLLELVEFAPLQDHGPTFSQAPASLHPREKARLAFEVIQGKSAHQGGDDRLLLVFCTEHAFWLDPTTIERLRRRLAAEPPRFDRVYYVSLHDLGSASVSEVYPGTPHHWFGEWTDEQLDRNRVIMPHPRDFTGTVAIPPRTYTVTIGPDRSKEPKADS